MAFSVLTISISLDELISERNLGEIHSPTRTPEPQKMQSSCRRRMAFFGLLRLTMKFGAGSAPQIQTFGASTADSAYLDLLGDGQYSTASMISGLIVTFLLVSEPSSTGVELPKTGAPARAFEIVRRCVEAARAYQSHVEMRELQNGFAIEKLYPNVKITMADNGSFHFSRASRAFILWRQKTAPWVPDQAFAFRYASIAQFIEAMGRQAALEKRRVQAARVRKVEKPITKLADLFATLESRVATEENGNLLFYPREEDDAVFENSVMYKFVLFEHAGKTYPVYLSFDNWFHNEIIRRVRARFPQVDVVSAGSISIRGQVTASGAYRFYPYKLTSGGWSGDFSVGRFERFFRIYQKLKKDFKLGSEDQLRIDWQKAPAFLEARPLGPISKIDEEIEAYLRN